MAANLVSVEQAIKDLEAGLSIRLVKVTAQLTLAAAGNYEANDVLSNSTSVGVPFVFKDVAKVAGGGGYIVRAKLTLSKAGGITAITPQCTLQLYTKTPTCNLNDAAINTGVLAADVPFHIGDIEFPALANIGGSPSSERVPSTWGKLPKAFVCNAKLKSIYGVLVILAAETSETSATIATIDLYIEQT